MTKIQDVTPLATALQRDNDFLVGARRTNPGLSPPEYGDIQIPAKILDQGTPYDLPFRFDGTPEAAPLIIQRMVVARPLLIPADFTGAYGWVSGNPDAAVVIDVSVVSTAALIPETFMSITIANDGVYSFSFGASPAAAYMIPAGARLSFTYQGGAGSPAADPSISDIDGIVGARIIT